MFDFLDTWQWIVVGIGALVFLWPRRQAILTKLTGASSSVTTTVDANSIAAAYRLLAPYLSPATAVAVRAEVAEVFLTTSLEPATASADVDGAAALMAMFERLGKFVEKIPVPPVKSPKRAKK